MNNKKIAITIIFLFHLVSQCKAQRVIDGKLEMTREIFNNNFEFTYNNKQIDQKLATYLKKEKGLSLEMVNPGQMFNTTDVFVEGLPNKRLVTIGKKANGSGFILYENGGNALYNICLIYKKISPKKYEILLLSLNNEIDTFEELKNTIESNNYTVLN